MTMPRSVTTTPSLVAVPRSTTAPHPFPTLPAPAAPVTAGAGALRRARGLAAVRIAFGLVWLVDATMKWSPTFRAQLLSDIAGQRSGQPEAVKMWLGWWVSLLGHQPHAVAYLLAVTETAIAVGLLLGALTNLVCVGGAVVSLLIWATAEGFGGPYGAGSTDIGTSVIYVVVFAALLAAGAGGWGGLDARLRPRFGRLCARPVNGLPPPSRRFVLGVAALTLLAVDIGALVAFVASPVAGMG